MKEALVAPGVKVTIHDVPIPQISDPRQILIQVIVSGSNPKDWKVPYIIKTAFNQGDDIAGFVHAVGDEVTEFKVGDRVGAFHEMITPSWKLRRICYCMGVVDFSYSQEYQLRRYVLTFNR